MPSITSQVAIYRSEQCFPKNWTSPVVAHDMLLRILEMNWNSKPNMILNNIEPHDDFFSSSPSFF